MRTLAILTAALGLALAAPAISASAMPLDSLASAKSQQDTVHQARLVCNAYGRCWRTGPRYRVVRRYYGPRYGYAPGYYAYGGAPYGYWGGPSVSFGFGFGPRWGW